MQFTLDGIPRTEKRRLMTKRKVLYDEMLRELNELTSRKITLVKTYNAKVKDIDTKLKRIRHAEIYSK